MKRKVVKLLLGILIIGIAVGAAFWGGAATGQLLSKSNHDDLLKWRKQNTTEILDNMGTIQEGGRLPDFQYFQSLDGKMDTLSHLVTRQTWIIFVQPDCPTCLDELDHLTSLMDKHTKIGIIVISNANPLDMIDLQKHYHLTCSILHDRHGIYTQTIKVSTYPFNVLVDSKLTIKRIVTNQLIEEDFTDY